MDIHRLTDIIQSGEAKLKDYVNHLSQTIHDDDRADNKTIATFADAFLELTLPSLIKCGKEYADQAVAICEVCLMKQKDGYYLMAKGIFNQTSLVKWEKRPEQVLRMVKRLSELVQPDKPKSNLHIATVESCVTSMMSAFTRGKLYKTISDDILIVLIDCYKSRSDVAMVVGKCIVECYDLKWKVKRERLSVLYNEILRWVKEININSESNKASLVCGTISCLDNDAILAPTELSRIYNHCVSQELYGSPFSGYGSIVHDILWVTVQKHYSTAIKIKDFVPGTVTLMNCGVKALEDAAGSAISNIYQHVDLLVPCAEEILQVYLDGKGGLSLGMVLKPLYQAAPEKIMRSIDNINESMEDMDDIEKTYLYILLDEIAKTKSQTLLPSLQIIVNDLRSTSNVYLAYMVVAEISSCYPIEVAKYYRTLLQTWDRVPDVTSSAVKTIANIGLMSEEDADHCLRAMVKRLHTMEEEHKGLILMEMKRIGVKYKDILIRYKSDIESEKAGTALGLSDTVKLVLDFLEDRTLEIMDTTVKGQRSEVIELDKRAQVNEEEVQDMTEELEHKARQITEVEHEQEKLGEEISEMEEEVKETGNKLTEIDQQTIVNAPKWSRDVSKILNPEHKYDWRYLAIRLGFSGEDVRNWALSPDPTMAILAEWYTTHKSSDATYAILTALQDMGRTEAAEIVEKALEEADQMVPKPVGEMSDKPCPVFISYQWDHQPEVKAVKDHLEMAGYGCWLDIGQMGGGDQLFAKINEGMRAAKLVLCMVTTKYAKSENCNKEVNLANLLNKPIIPILIENIPWPPEGSMSMLFAQLLYIQFFSEGEYVRGKKFWPDDRFHELLGQIGYYATPNTQLLRGEYRKKISNLTKHPNRKDQDIEVPNSTCDIFLSYELDMRSKVTDIQHHLTEQDLTCWMDSPEVNATKPRKEVVEDAVRRAQVIVACLSEKYFLSSDSKRQLTMSDELDKPILLVLLEQGMTWPPNGPISTTLSNKDCIDVRRYSTAQSNELIVEKVKKMFDLLEQNNNIKSTSTKNPENIRKEDKYLKDVKKSVNKERNVSDSVMKGKAPSPVYVKHVSAPGSSRSLPETSRHGPHNRLPGRADSDQGIPKRNKHSRRSTVCIII
ncbi:uncharacterized protein [Apostichopus japonicus]|uniref:uncharacterized protein isoform X1 n=1 Tax=Stichopus japonicus TaxID=307972 RepID=UPI003AB4A5CC